MAERRALVEGLKPAAPVDPVKEKEFVFGSPPSAATTTAPEPSPVQVAKKPGRVQLSTKMRADLAEALTQASLKRRLSGEVPNKVQDILEAALEPWLRANGYLE